MLAAVQLALLQIVYEIQILSDRHFKIEGRLLGQIAYLALSRYRILQNVDAVYLGFARRARQISGQNAHRCGFSRAVRPEETDDLSLLNGETDIVHRLFVSIPFYKIFDSYHLLLQFYAVRRYIFKIYYRDRSGNFPKHRPRHARFTWK